MRRTPLCQPSKAHITHICHIEMTFYADEERFFTISIKIFATKEKISYLCYTKLNHTLIT